MNALVFLYKKVLKQPLDGRIDAVRARKKQNIPVVLSIEEVVSVISLMKGTPHLVVKLLYGSGVRMMEALRLRVQDINYDLKQITVRSGKGNKDRVSTFPVSLAPLLQSHLTRVKAIHQKDISEGYGAVYLPTPWIVNIPMQPGSGNGNMSFHHHDLYPCARAGRAWG